MLFVRLWRRGSTALRASLLVRFKTRSERPSSVSTTILGAFYDHVYIRLLHGTVRSITDDSRARSRLIHIFNAAPGSQDHAPSVQGKRPRDRWCCKCIATRRVNRCTPKSSRAQAWTARGVDSLGLIIVVPNTDEVPCLAVKAWTPTALRQPRESSYRLLIHWVTGRPLRPLFSPLISSGPCDTTTSTSNLCASSPIAPTTQHAHSLPSLLFAVLKQPFWSCVRCQQQRDRCEYAPLHHLTPSAPISNRHQPDREQQISCLALEPPRACLSSYLLPLKQARVAPSCTDTRDSQVPTQESPHRIDGTPHRVDSVTPFQSHTAVYHFSGHSYQSNPAANISTSATAGRNNCLSRVTSLGYIHE